MKIILNEAGNKELWQNVQKIEGWRVCEGSSWWSWSTRVTLCLQCLLALCWVMLWHAEGWGVSEEEVRLLFSGTGWTEFRVMTAADTFWLRSFSLPHQVKPLLHPAPHCSPEPALSPSWLLVSHVSSSPTLTTHRLVSHGRSAGARCSVSFQWKLLFFHLFSQKCLSIVSVTIKTQNKDRVAVVPLAWPRPLPHHLPHLDSNAPHNGIYPLLTRQLFCLLINLHGKPDTFLSIAGIFLTHLLLGNNLHSVRFWWNYSWLHFGIFLPIIWLMH